MVAFVSRGCGRYLDMSSNKLSGSIPAALSLLIGNHYTYSTVYMDLSGNALSGALPNQLSETNFKCVAGLREWVGSA